MILGLMGSGCQRAAPPPLPIALSQSCRACHSGGSSAIPEIPTDPEELRAALAAARRGEGEIMPRLVAGWTEADLEGVVRAWTGRKAER